MTALPPPPRDGGGCCGEWNKGHEGEIYTNQIKNGKGVEFYRRAIECKYDVYISAKNTYEERSGKGSGSRKLIWPIGEALFFILYFVSDTSSTAAAALTISL